ncbi:MAG: glycosyltransferase [Chlorobiaceae bacterium]|nr:glycosyltransferase [Chlorobiaceae bacterium]NTW10272.1 glycosyltransferase [Chlorobiaceae bacterium]
MKPSDSKSCSLVITTYNWPEALDLTLRSVFAQSELPDEIIVADDGSTGHTAELIESHRAKSGISLIHVWQEDRGFRAAASRNRAIAAASGEYIVIVDGDMILHRDFIRDHKKFALEGTFIQGSRVLISQANTSKRLRTRNTKVLWSEFGIENRIHAIHVSLLAQILASINKKLHGIRSCNMSFFKEDCVRVNGFNEDFTGWGREDSEFAVRMINSGILRRNLKFSAIAYHLWHEENKRDSLPENDLLLEKALKEMAKFCQNGIDKYSIGTH